MTTTAGSREAILEAVGAYAEGAVEPERFVAGVSHVPVSGRVLDSADICALVDASLDGWLTAGRFTARFQDELARYVGVRSALFVNSGSSANLLALTALTSRRLERSAGPAPLRPGDEVLTVAMGFPTTVNPIVQNGLRPVVVDVSLPTYDVNVDELAAAVGPRTRAIMLAHTLGNPFDVDAVQRVCEEHDLWLIEDACDAMGSRYRERRAGSFGDTATASFYPAHHITTGEGGAVFVNSPVVRKQVESFRDWGRDCYCETGHDNTCGRRFDWQLGNLPPGYDHKYIYSNIGYNLKATDMQAALGLSQLSKLDAFVAKRKANFARLASGLAGLEELILPEATPGSDPAWFGFPVTLHPDCRLERDALVRHLDGLNIGTRLMFAGNILKQPAYLDVDVRAASDLTVTDTIMSRTFWVGVYPGLTPEMLDFVVDAIRGYVEGAR